MALNVATALWTHGRLRGGWNAAWGVVFLFPPLRRAEVQRPQAEQLPSPCPVANAPRRKKKKKKMLPNPGRLVISVRFIVCDRLCAPFGSRARSREKLGPRWWNADQLLAFRGCSGWGEWAVYVSHRVVPCRCWVKSYITAHHPCLMMSELWAALRSWECPPKYSLSLIQLLQWVNLPDSFQMS